MKQCTNCGTMLTADATYCNVCNTQQTAGFDEFDPKPRYNDTFLKVLCILTIVGAAFSLISGVFSSLNNGELPVEGVELIGYVSLALSVVKLGSAIAMLKKKLAGLYLYSIAAVLAIGTQIYTAMLTSDYMNTVLENSGAPIGGSGIMIVGTAVIVLFYLAFLIMYWLPVNKRHLS